ncbi:MAG: ATP-grasp domain-containing protein [Candidatus Melainabacteria bacterium]|nr:ATP-grasp domain-containing protein [Candidatus Melainabacteria bacterium]
MDRPTRKVLLLSPTNRAAQALSSIGESLNCEIIKDERSKGSFLSNFRYGETLDIVELIESRVALHQKEKIDGITCTVAFPGMNVAAACIAKKLGVPGPSPEAILTCEHKYYCRLAQEKFVPEATADFQLIDPSDESSVKHVTKFPRFVKPVKSILSSGAFRVNSQSELRKAVHRDSLPVDFLKPFNELIDKYSDFEHQANYFLVEELLEGWQVSLEGFVYQNEITIMGIVDAIMFPGTISFKRFQYPSALSENVQSRMADIAKRFIGGIGYNNWAFNIEMMYNPVTEKIHIIEVNARLASQFWDLFEKVDGSNPFEAILKIAVGEKPQFKHRQGRFKVAASCVLRTFEDKLVSKIPTSEDITRLQNKYPDAFVEVLAKVDRRLSEQIQDSGSFRYGLINIGADSCEHLESKFNDCASMLPYSFEELAVMDSSLQRGLET